MDLRNFSLKLLFLMPILGLVIGMNYTVDPAHLFQDSYERGIANLLLKGKNVANVDNYDDRLVQKLYVEGVSGGKDILIFGSSHVMSIHATLFPGKTAFNHSVSGASLPDHIAIAEMYHKKGIALSTVVIALDPWLLNRNNGQVMWLRLEAEYQAAVDRLGLPLNPVSVRTRASLDLNKYPELISPSYFQESLRFWLIGLQDPSLIPGNYYATDETIGDVAIRLSDGSLSRNRRERSRDPYVNYSNAIVTLKKFNRLDPDLENALEIWVSSLKEEGVKVIFFLAPYHPDAYLYLVESPNYRIIVDAQRYYEELAHRNGIRVLGSYDPAYVPCTAEEFYDEQHPKESCIERIWSNGFGSD